MSNHFSEICNNHSFSKMSGHLAWHFVSTTYILVQEKLDTLVAFTSGALHRSVQPESNIHTGVPGHLCVVSIFIQFVCPLLCRDSFTRCIGSTVLLPVTVVLFSTGYGGLAPIHIRVLRWSGYAVSLLIYLI